MVKIAIILIGILLSACATSPSAPYAAVPGQDAANAQATLTAYNLEMSATREAAALQTAVAVRATQESSAQQTAVAEVAAVAASATAQGLNVRATEQSLILASDAATGTAVAGKMVMEATIAAGAVEAAQRATNIAMLQEDETARLAQDRRRADIVNAMLPIVYSSVIAAALSFTGFVIWRMVYLSRNPYKVIAYNGQELPLVAYNGQYRPIISPPPQLPSGNGHKQLPAVSAAIRRDERPPAVSLPVVPMGHVLIAGPTGSGKSTAMRELVRQRMLSADEAYSPVTVLDPHHLPGTWATPHVVGGGGDYEAIGRCFDALMLELETRMRRREQGFTAFRPLTVATDEMPSIIARCGRDVGDAWRRLVREGDKFRLWLIVGSQSTRVRSLGIEGEGDVLDNFHAVLYLGELARQEFGGLVGGMERPAVLHARNEPPRAVLVPYTPVRPMEQAAVTISPVRDTAVEYQAILTERDGLITPDEVAEIAAMLRQNFSQRRIESIVFGYCGGSSFRKVQSVKNHLEAAVVAR